MAQNQTPAQRAALSVIYQTQQLKRNRERREGGSPPPPPPPPPSSSTPLILSDFKNGVYEINGTPTTLAGVWEENTDFGPFSAAQVIADLGLNTTDSSMPAAPVLTSAAYALLGGGPIVVVFDFLMTLTDPVNTIMGVSAEYCDLPNFVESWVLEASYRPSVDPTQGFQIGNYSNLFPLTVVQSQAGGVLIGTSRRAAVRFDTAGFAGSFDGGAPVTTDAPEAATFTHFAIVAKTQDVGTSSTIERVAIYSAAEYANGDLPALSTV